MPWRLQRGLWRRRPTIRARAIETGLVKSTGRGRRRTPDGVVGGRAGCGQPHQLASYAHAGETEQAATEARRAAKRCWITFRAP
jgi:hypothetical protein